MQEPAVVRLGCQTATHGLPQTMIGNTGFSRTVSFFRSCYVVAKECVPLARPISMLIVVISVTAVSAQDNPRPVALDSSSDNATKQQTVDSAADPLPAIRQKLKRLTSETSKADLDDASRQEIGNLLTQTAADLELINELRQQNTALQQQPGQLAIEAEELRQSPSVTDVKPVDSMTIEELEAEAATESVSLTSAQQTLATFQQAAEKSVEQKQALKDNVLKTEQTLTATGDNWRQLPQTPVTLLDTARHIAAEALQLKAAADHDLAQTRLAKLDAELALDLPSMRASHQQQMIALHQERQTALEEQLAALRKEQSREELDKAQQAETQLEQIQNREIRKLGEHRLEMATENDRLTQQAIPHWEQVRDRRLETLEGLKSTGRKIRTRVERFGTDTAMGHQLLYFGSTLPSVVEIRQEMISIDDLTAGCQLQKLEFGEIQQRIRIAGQQTGDQGTEAEQEILTHIPGVLDRVKRTNDRFFDLLGDVNAADRDTIAFIEQWSEFSAEHALWLRSHDPLTQQDFSDALPTMRRSSRHAIDSLRATSTGGEISFWVLVIPAGLAIVVLLLVQSRAKDGLLRRGEEASKKTCRSLMPTIWALLLSLGMAAEWPLFLMLIGSILQSQSNGMAMVLGQTMVQLGGIALWLNFFRQVLRQGGLASHHFNWNSAVCDRLRRWLRLVFIVVSGPMFLFLLARNIPEQTDSVERVLFLLLLICSTALLLRLFFPITGRFVQQLVSQSRFLQITRYFWCFGIVAAPVFLAICSATGFHHTALSLWDRLGWSVVVATGVILGWSLTLRWLRMNHRATRLELARERAQQTEHTEAPSENPLPQTATTDESELLVFGTQARQLVRNVSLLVMIGCAWGIWFDILPALHVVDRYELWNIREQISTTELSEAGDETTSQTWKSRSITVSSLLLVLFTATATLIGVRQLPGLIEVILLRQTSLDGGVRYTITTVLRYIVLIVGTSLICHSLGLRWSQVQWLVAGLSVGLGFGLQEVFANFVSGIILLIERPIRIGDVVTVDGVSGVVSKIQIRATSITDWDRREYIVPNRELGTGKLLNWTLSDSTNRIVIAVGIGYTCDPDQARSTMLRIAGEHPNILEDPGPIATFENFGDSSLDLVLRAFLPDMDNRLGTITDLHTQIHRSFAEEGIDIPFPQREVRML